MSFWTHFVPLKHYLNNSGHQVAPSWTFLSANIKGADSMIPQVPQITKMRNIQSKIRSITMATYFHSSTAYKSENKTHRKHGIPQKSV